MRSIRKRRLSKKTDYAARLALLKSSFPRLVVRRTNRYMIVQIVESEQAKDKVLLGITSKVLLEKGWSKEHEGSLKNKAASYLTGYILGKMAVDKEIKAAILDTGMHRNVHKSRLYAVLKGAIDSGLKIPCNKDALPTDEELSKETKFKEMITKIKKK